MKRIIGKRDSGKTRDLLLYAADKQAIVVCKNPNAMKQKSISYGIVGLTFTSYADFKKSVGETPFVIDDVDNFLTSITNNVIGYTLTNED